MARKPAPRKRGRDAREDRGKRKVCQYCKNGISEVDYKQHTVLRTYVSEKGKIRSRRISGACRRHQRKVAVAIKRAREMALLPYATG